MQKTMTMVVYNDTFGMPKLSREAIAWMKARGYRGKFSDARGELAVPRHHPLLVACIEELGEAADWSIGGCGSRFRVAEVEGDSYYVIPYDMREAVIGEKDLVSTRGKDALFVESFDPEKVFFTADTHFCHENILKYGSRPFDDITGMDRELIRRWNETVPEDGVVFHLGDFAHASASRWRGILEQLNGTIHLIAGNHDTATAKRDGLEGFASVHQQRLIDVGGQRIYLNHYPFLCYGGAYDSVWQLFGHVHSGPGLRSGLDHPRLKMLFPLQCDVGVDNNGYRPVSFFEVKEKIGAQVTAAGGRAAEPSSAIRSGAPVVFLDVDGVLVTSPAGREPDSVAARNLKRLLGESGARLVFTGGWAAFRTEDLRDGPLRAFSEALVGTTRQAPTHTESVAGWLSTAGGKHRYVVLSTTPTDDTRAVLVDPSAGLTADDVDKALEILR